MDPKKWKSLRKKSNEMKAVSTERGSLEKRAQDNYCCSSTTTLTKRTINSPWSTKNDTNLISIVLFCISRWLLGCVALLWGEEDKDVRERDRFSIESLPLSSTDCLDVLFFPRNISGEKWHSFKDEDAVEVDYSHLTKVVKEGAMKTGRQMKDIPCHTTCLG